MVNVKQKDHGATFEVRVQPRAARAEIAGEHDGALKVRVTAPPLEGRANDECVRVLARSLGVPRGSIEIIAGQTSRTKVIHVHGVSAENLAEILSHIN